MLEMASMTAFIRTFSTHLNGIGSDYWPAQLRRCSKY
jgi:hypothetical protein